MTYKEDCTPLLCHISHLAETFLLKFCIADGEHFIHDQYFRLEMCRDCKSEPQIHAGGISFDGRINKLTDFREINNFIEFIVNLIAFHSQDRTVHINILSSSKFRMKTCPYF